MASESVRGKNRYKGIIEEVMKKERIQFIDTIRGLVLVSMILYHASWNLVYIYGVKWDWFHGTGAYLWQQSICWTFILLSGFCFSLAKRHFKSGITVFGSGVLVTAVTIAVMPQNRVVFGVLTCIGTCILLLAAGEKWLKKIPAEWGVLFSFLIFLFTKSINNGYGGIGNILKIQLPGKWYCNYFTTFLGFPFPQFFSTDYFSLFPWFFLFITGFYMGLICQKKDRLQHPLWRKKIKFFAYAGRHSLVIYLLHQPVIFALQEMIF